MTKSEKEKKPTRFCSDSERDEDSEESEKEGKTSSKEKMDREKIPTPPRGFGGLSSTPKKLQRLSARSSPHKSPILRQSPRKRLISEERQPTSKRHQQQLHKSTNQVKQQQLHKSTNQVNQQQLHKSTNQVNQQQLHKSTNQVNQQRTTTIQQQQHTSAKQQYQQERPSSSTQQTQLSKNQPSSAPHTQSYSAALLKPRSTTREIEDESDDMQDTLQKILSKINTIEENIKEIREHVICTKDVDVDVDEILQSKMNSVQEVKDFEDRLDENAKRKLIYALSSLQGGSDAGDICRAIMRVLMTNYAMSFYSGTGQKGKKPFVETQVYKIILAAARKASKKTIPFLTLKAEIIEVLRNAPNKPGGTNYIKKKRTSRTHRDNFPEDSE